MTLQQFWYANRGKKVAVSSVAGDCLEGAGICDGDIIKVSLTKMPMPPVYTDGKCSYYDLCLCFGSAEQGTPPVMMVKEYCGTFGPMQQVGTRYKYKPGRLDFQFEPVAIFGVIYKCFSRDGTLKWSRDISGHPDMLSTKGTIQGGNVGMVGTLLKADGKIYIKEEKIHA